MYPTQEEIERAAAEARAAQIEASKTQTIVLCLRDPDYDNSYEIFVGTEPGVVIFDIDLGRSDLSDEAEYADWRESHMQDVSMLHEAGRHDVGHAYQLILDAQAGQ